MKTLLVQLLVFSSGFIQLKAFVENLIFDESDDLCSRQLEHYKESFDRDVLWARIMRDSWGSLPSGTFSGNLFDFGSFDQCIELSHETANVGKILGQHCTLLIPLEGNDSRNNFTKLMPPSRRLCDIKYDAQHIPAFFNIRSSSVIVGVGICVPASCSPDQIKEIADETLMTSLNVKTSPFYDQNAYCTTNHRPFESSTSLLIFATIFFALILVLVIASTAYDIYCDLKDISKSSLLSSFSLYTNSKKILSMKPASSREITCLHGIRSLSMMSIVLGHTFMITYWMAPAINSHMLIEWLGDASSMIVLVGFLGVDTFFMLSSLLLTLSVFRELKTTKKINIFKLYIKRYFRITVPLAAGILFTVTFLYHVSNGPLWKLTTRSAAIDLCNDWWFTTLLFVGNYVNPGQLCFGHSWYLMVDMQLYFLSPIILYPLWRWRKHSAVMIAMILFIASSSVIFVFVVILKQEFRVNFMSELNFSKNAMVYTVTHGRIDSWMIGILVGYMLHKAEGKTIRLTRLFVITGWTLSIAILLAVTFGQQPLLQENFKENPPMADAVYDSLKRISWCLSMAWIIFACHLSHGGVVNHFLSLPIWLPISKLSFCMYLIHLPVQLVFMSSIRAPQYFSNFRAIYKFFGDFGVSFVIAFVWALMFEYPTLNVISILTKKI